MHNYQDNQTIENFRSFQSYKLNFSTFKQVTNLKLGFLPDVDKYLEKKNRGKRAKKTLCSYLILQMISTDTAQHKPTEHTRKILSNSFLKKKNRLTTNGEVENRYSYLFIRMK